MINSLDISKDSKQRSLIIAISLCLLSSTLFSQDNHCDSVLKIETKTHRGANDYLEYVTMCDIHILKDYTFYRLRMFKSSSKELDLSLKCHNHNGAMILIMIGTVIVDVGYLYLGNVGDVTMENNSTAVTVLAEAIELCFAVYFEKRAKTHFKRAIANYNKEIQNR